MIAKWRGSEPVRLVAYPALAALVLYLVGRSGADPELADLVLAAVALVLGVPAAEFARRQVTPPDHLGEVIADGADAVLDQVDAELTRRLGPGAADVLRQARDRVAELRAEGGRHLLPEGDG